MVMWLWVGGVITAFGALLAAVPGPSRRRRRVASRETVPDGAHDHDDDGGARPPEAGSEPMPKPVAEPVGAAG
jgi:hypothetical protein